MIKHGALFGLEPLAAPRHVFLTHGEAEPAHAFAAELRDRRGWTCHVPQLGETHELRWPAHR